MGKLLQTALSAYTQNLNAFLLHTKCKTNSRGHSNNSPGEDKILDVFIVSPCAQPHIIYNSKLLPMDEALARETSKQSL